MDMIKVVNFKSNLIANLMIYLFTKTKTIRLYLDVSTHKWQIYGVIRAI